MVSTRTAFEDRSRSPASRSQFGPSPRVNSLLDVRTHVPAAYYDFRRTAVGIPRAEVANEVFEIKRRSTYNIVRRSFPLNAPAHTKVTLCI